MFASSGVVTSSLHLDLVLLTASLIAAFASIWKVARFIFRIDRALPTLLNIAAQFEENHGSTVRDKINQIVENQSSMLQEVLSHKAELEIADRFTLSVAEDSRTIAQTNAAIVKELSETSVSDLLHIKEYMHDNMHLIRNQLQESNYRKAELDKDVKTLTANLNRLEERIDGLIPFIIRRRESDSR